MVLRRRYATVSGGHTKCRYSRENVLVYFTLLSMFCISLFGSIALPTELQTAQQETRITEALVQKNSPKKTPSLQIVWLMSFPNSGTSYTSQFVRQSTLTRTASNYARAKAARTNTTTITTNIASVPVFNDQPSGPFWTDIDEHPEYTVPSEYVLTKTHCGAPCVDCPPDKYIQLLYDFRQHCLSGDRLDIVNGSKRIIEKVTYPITKLAKKAVHVMRNPFDNIVSRFRYERKNNRSATDFPNTQKGFRTYCQVLNQRYVSKERKALSNDLLDLLKDVPCRADFIRYMEWHNMAFVTANDLGLENIMVLYYEDYATRFNETTQQLLDFLHLRPVAQAAPFVAGKTYEHYFTEQERTAVKHAFQMMALQSTWKYMRVYYDENDLQEEARAQK